MENPRKPSSSASQLAAMLPPAEPIGEGSVRGRLTHADFEGGDFVLRLTGATASMRALAQLLGAQGLEVEIVVRRRAP